MILPTKNKEKKYFGEGCNYFVGHFEEDASIPELVYCQHPKNESDSEGNCREGFCPIDELNLEDGKEEMNKEVYCGNCKFMVLCGARGWTKRCEAGEIERDYKGDKLYHTECEIKNQNKDCEDYKRKWWKFWV